MLEHLSSLPTQMDYKGQKLAEQMFQGIILFSAIVGFIYGYVAEQFGWTGYKLWTKHLLGGERDQKVCGRYDVSWRRCTQRMRRRLFS